MSKRKLSKFINNDNKEIPILHDDLWGLIVSFIDKTDILTLLNFLGICKNSYKYIKNILFDLYTIIEEGYFYIPKNTMYSTVNYLDNEIIKYLKNGFLSGNTLNKKHINVVFNNINLDNIIIFIKFIQNNFNIFYQFDKITENKFIRVIMIMKNNNYFNNDSNNIDIIYLNSLLLSILNLSILDKKYLRSGKTSLTKECNKDKKIKLKHPYSSTLLKNIYYYSNTKDKVIPLYKLNKIKIIKEDEQDIINKNYSIKSKNSSLKREVNNIKREKLIAKFLSYINKNFKKSKQEIYTAALNHSNNWSKLAIIYNTLMNELELIKPTKNDIYENIVVKKGKNYDHINSEDLYKFRNKCFIYNRKNNEANIFYKLYFKKDEYITKINNELSFISRNYDNGTIWKRYTSINHSYNIQYSQGDIETSNSEEYIEKDDGFQGIIINNNNYDDNDNDEYSDDTMYNL